MLSLFIILVLFQIKHFICDYPLQTSYMLGKLRKDNWIAPLAVHSLVHAVGTFLITFVFSTFYLAIALSLTDFVLHFIVDRIKASPNLLGRFKPDQPYFWWALGIDQMTHHLINYAFIAIIIFYN